MNNRYSIQGDVNNRGSNILSADRTFKDILLKEAGGMIENRRVKMIQIGGPLGKCINNEEINLTIGQLEGDAMTKDIYYFSNLLCPVDYLRFITRYMIREVKHDTDRMRKLNELVEKIAQGQSTVRDLEDIKMMTAGSVDTKADELFNQVFNTVMEKYEDEIMEHIDDRKCRNGICRGLIVSQCINACPAGINIPGYVELMKRDMHKEAYALMRQENPLSFICGKVCARPCEDRCRRREIESTVGVRALQRFAASAALDGYEEDRLPSNGKSIGIIGAGPGGLTSAYYLARSGYDVTIYEAEKHVGGMLAFGVPSYRLPYEDILKEVKTIEAHGVKILTETRVGVDIEFDQIRKSHDAVLVASGCHVGNTLPGYDNPNVETAASFLRQVRLEDRKTIGKRVLVVGGGDVSMDALRTSIRLGAETASLVSLESYEEMPAGMEERVQAVEENAELLNGWGVKDLEFADEITVTLKECTRVFDDSYRFSPHYNEDNTREIKVDTVILAIGQKPDLSYLPEDINKFRGFASVDKRTYETSMEGVFAVGDASKPSIAIEAIAGGKKAASSMDRYLGGRGLYTGKTIEIPESPLKITTWDDPLTLENHLEADARKDSFREISHEYTLEEAKLEASRCMRCDRNSRRPLLLTPRR